jgi:CubicO group peptidase (beta-lactamase class C family)
MKIAALLPICLVFAFSPGGIYSKDNELKDLDAFVEKARLDYGVPGVSVAVVKDGKAVFVKGFGVSKVGSEAKIDGDTIFQLASVTKTFAAASVGVMVDRGKIGFDEQLINILPDFALKDPYPTRYATARDFLSHRSGLPAFTGDLLDHLGHSRQEVIRKVRFMEPACSFREEANYSNMGFFLAGESAAVAAGTTWEELVEESLLKPLGMKRSGFTREVGQQKNTAFPHAIIEGETQVVPYNKQLVLAPAGGMTSTAADMAHYMAMLLDGGKYQGKEVLKPGTVQQMFTATMVEEPGFAELPPISETNGYAYGLGWGVYHWKNHRIVEKGGALDGMRSITVLVPEKNLGITALANMNLTVLPEAIRAYVLERYLGKADEDMQAEIMERSKKIAAILNLDGEDEIKNPQPPSLDLKAYTGKYQSDLYGVFTIGLEEGALSVAAGPAQYPGSLTHVNYDTFHLRWPIVISGPDETTFTIGPDGKVRGFTTETIGTFERIE